MNQVFNHEMVQIARESRGWTTTKLANESGLTQGFISQLESGDKGISEENIEKIATALAYPVSFFFQKDAYEGFGISLVYYRKKASTKKGDIRRLQAEKNIRRMHLGKVLKHVEIETPHGFEFMDIDEFDGNVEKIAALLRASWKLPLGPVKNLVSTIERAGGVVMRFDFGTRDIEALSEWPTGGPPFFYLNSKAPSCRTRFSLAHELGHIIMHRHASDTMEHEADAFASEFLMPQREISTQLDDMTIQKAARLKPHWRVSMAAIIRRSKDLGRIPKDMYSRLFRKLGHLGYRKNEPVSISDEQPSLVNKMIQAFEETHEFNREALAQHWCIHLEELNYYLPDTGGLRIA